MPQLEIIPPSDECFRINTLAVDRLVNYNVAVKNKVQLIQQSRVFRAQAQQVTEFSSLLDELILSMSIPPDSSSRRRRNARKNAVTAPRLTKKSRNRCVDL